MSIFQLPYTLTGDVGIYPSFKPMVSGDDLATITTAGYLNGYNLQANPVSNGDMIYCLYNATKNNGGSYNGTFAILTVSINGLGIITLSEWKNSGNVLLPVTPGNFAIFNDSNGQIADTGKRPSNALKTNVVMLDNGSTIGNIPAFVDQQGTIADTTIAASAVMQNNIFNEMTDSGTIVLFKVNGSESGGTLALNGNSGEITTSSLTTGPGNTFLINWSNIFIATDSTICLTLSGGSNTFGAIGLSVRVSGTGTAVIAITNLSGTLSFNGTVKFKYAIF